MNDSQVSPQLPALARAKQVCHALGIHRTTLHQWIKSGTFPEPLKVGGRNCWLWTVVREWLDAKNKAVPA
ncbi:MAG: AlpA family phage regulatory protein [Nitrosomonas ureae]